MESWAGRLTEMVDLKMIVATSLHLLLRNSRSCRQQTALLVGFAISLFLQFHILAMKNPKKFHALLQAVIVLGMSP